MAEEKKIRIVIASPGDVQAERRSLPTIIEELNEGIGGILNLRLQLTRWETDVYPGFHVDGPQGHIDSILRIQDCDLLLGIFWKRFGKPVKDAASGTEHEFKVAYDTWKHGGTPHIMMYFNQKPYTPQSQEETEQWGRVLEFRKSIADEGVFVTYNGVNKFKDLTRKHLTQWLRDKYGSPHHESPPVTGPPYDIDPEALDWFKMTDEQVVNDEQMQSLREQGYEFGGPRYGDEDALLMQGWQYVVWKGLNGKFYRLCNYKPVEQGNVYMMKKTGKGEVPHPHPVPHFAPPTRYNFAALWDPTLSQKEPPRYDDQGLIIPPPQKRRRRTYMDVSHFAERVRSLDAPRRNEEQSRQEKADKANLVLRRFEAELEEIAATFEDVVGEESHLEIDSSLVYGFGRSIDWHGNAPTWSNNLAVTNGQEVWMSCFVTVHMWDDGRLNIRAMYGIGGATHPKPVLWRITWNHALDADLRDAAQTEKAIGWMIDDLQGNLPKLLDEFTKEKVEYHSADSQPAFS